jgi:hypothetical protein
MLAMATKGIRNRAQVSGLDGVRPEKIRERVRPTAGLNTINYAVDTELTYCKTAPVLNSRLRDPVGWAIREVT